jgi:hypothetical protein
LIWRGKDNSQAKPLQNGGFLDFCFVNQRFGKNGVGRSKNGVASLAYVPAIDVLGRPTPTPHKR